MLSRNHNEYTTFTYRENSEIKVTVKLTGVIMYYVLGELRPIRTYMPRNLRPEDADILRLGS